LSLFREGETVAEIGHFGIQDLDVLGVLNPQCPSEKCLNPSSLL